MNDAPVSIRARPRGRAISNQSNVSCCAYGNWTHGISPSGRYPRRPYSRCRARRFYGVFAYTVMRVPMASTSTRLLRCGVSFMGCSLNEDEMGVIGARHA